MTLRSIKPSQAKHNQTLENIDNLPDIAMVRLAVIQELIGVSKATLYRMISAGKLKQYKLSARCSTFQLGEVRAFLASKMEDK